jgi:cbb3-type cytochrome oxidase subunit 3
MRSLLTSWEAASAINAGLVAFFFFMFVGLIFWVFSRSRRSRYEEISKLPFDDNIGN